MKENLGPSPSPADLVRINDGLLQAVVEAKAAFATAKLASAKAKELNEHLGGNHPDGTAALLNALRAERAATERYTEAIRALTQFVLDHKVSGNP